MAMKRIYLTITTVAVLLLVNIGTSHAGNGVGAGECILVGKNCAYGGTSDIQSWANGKGNHKTGEEACGFFYSAIGIDQPCGSHIISDVVHE